MGTFLRHSVVRLTNAIIHCSSPSCCLPAIIFIRVCGSNSADLYARRLLAVYCKPKLTLTHVVGPENLESDSRLAFWILLQIDLYPIGL